MGDNAMTSVKALIYTYTNRYVSHRTIPICLSRYVQYVQSNTGVHKFFQHLRSHLKILGSRMVTWSKLLTEDSLILGAIVQN
jgi:hypothetical protein